MELTKQKAGHYKAKRHGLTFNITKESEYSPYRPSPTYWRIHWIHWQPERYGGNSHDRIFDTLKEARAWLERSKPHMVKI